uniref:SP110 nuclear body protein n=1 Tax=Lynx canadensis TaxID=61383 RepID=A0A667GJ41_LYNCA
MFTMTRALEKTLRQHFIYQKLEIAYAIHKPFPFLEGLRDNSFITETMYRESMEAYRNQVPVPRLVYNILSHLEKMFNLSFLQILFSRINLREYPDLTRILKSFRSVVISYGGWNRAGPTLLEVPANSAKGSSLQTLLSLPPPQHRSQSLSPREPSVSEPSASTQHPPGPAVALPRATQEGRITPGEKQTLSNTCQTEPSSEGGDITGIATLVSVTTNRSNQGRAGFSLCLFQALNRILFPLIEIRDVSPEPNDPKEFQGASITLPNKKGKGGLPFSLKTIHKSLFGPGRASPEHTIQKKLQLMDQATERKDDSTSNSEVITRAQKARTGCTQTSGPQGKAGYRICYKCSMWEGLSRDGHGVGWMCEGNGRRRERCRQDGKELLEKKRNNDVSSSSTRRCQKNIPPKEKPEDDPVDFHSPKLPVTCGEARGILYKERLKRGSSEKCIQNEEGIWFTPKEFEIEGKRATSRKWKQSVHCRGKTLEELLKKGLLFCPPRINVKRKVNSR